MVSIFAGVKDAPTDPVFGVAQAYKADTAETKVDLGVGAYRDDSARAVIFPCVRAVDIELASDASVDKEYLPMDGVKSLQEPSKRLVFIDSKTLAVPGAVKCPNSEEKSKCRAVEKFGKSAVVKNASAATSFMNRVASIQAHSGTGALMIAADYIKNEIPQIKKVMISDPTWPIHRRIFANKGFEVSTYAYWDAEKRGVDTTKLLEALRACEPLTMIVLHACGHNPTGADLDAEWIEVKKIVKEKNLIPLFDMAYQGFSSGCFDCDAHSIRFFTGLTPYMLYDENKKDFLPSGDDTEMQAIVCQSYAKNMGLYGERLGMLHFVCANESEALKVQGGLKYTTRGNIGTCSLHGARLAERILNKPENFVAWVRDLNVTTDRIKSVRKKLYQLLTEDFKTPGDWSHIDRQIGMFSYTGLSAAQAQELGKSHHIYLMHTGRISLSGLNSSNIHYVAKAFDTVVRQLS